MRTLLNPYNFAPAGVTPEDFPNLILWFRSDFGVEVGGVTPVDGGVLDYWEDKVSGTANAVQATAAWQPTYHTNQLNGHPVLRFAGTPITSNFAQHLRIPNANCPAAFTGIGTGEYTVFAIYKPAAFTNGQYLFQKTPAPGNTNSQIPGIQIAITTGILQIQTGTNVIQGTASSTLAAAAWNRAGIARSEAGSFMRWFVDGLQTHSAALSSGAGNNTNPAMLGARFDGSSLGDTGAAGMVGDLAEIVVYNTPFDSTQAASLDTYFAARYGF